MFSRRDLFRGTGAIAASALVAAKPLAHARTPQARAIDRRAVVSRHDVVRTASDRNLPLQVGNGRFAFGADITGLQTFLPFATMSDWGWHEDPLPPGESPDDYAGEVWHMHGRPIRYWTDDPQHPKLHQWLRQNPHRINLARIGLRLRRADEQEADEGDLINPHQHLELWTGTLRSTFSLDGTPVTVETTCHPDLDEVAIRVESNLVRSGQLAVFIDFPYATATDKFSAPFVGIWDRPEAHTTQLERQGRGRAEITHTLDRTTYYVGLRWGRAAELVPDTKRPHRYMLTASHSSQLELTCLFSPDRPGQAAPASAVSRMSAARWPRFWQSGGAVDLSQSTDPRWRELERRTVLSQYLMAVNEAGAFPPQESGLVNDGWYGKFHMEMYWWHAFHYALWNRWPLLRRSYKVYETFLSLSRRRAKRQGFRGARWPKMTSIRGRQSPGTANTLLLWQQPHPIFLAELDYRAHPNRKTLARWRKVLFATADFMASYAWRNPDTGYYDLGPPMMLANEGTNPHITQNPAFELSYWRYGLRVAQRWRKRLGLDLDPHWEAVLDSLAPLPVQHGRYVLYEGIDNMWSQHTTDHPDPIAAYGMLPGDGVDEPTMRATAHQVYAKWNLDESYGWDFPLLAMNAARLGDPERAIDFLLDERFHCTASGYPASGKSSVPAPYFPAAGGLLYAIAMMCAGWDGASDSEAPGFPKNGEWSVRWEGLDAAP